jgi:glycine oxidase
VNGDRVTGVRLADGELIEAAVVVVAAGVWSGALLNAALGPTAVQPMFAGTGTALVVRRPNGPTFDTVVRTPNRGGACGLHAVPLGAGQEYIGASNLVDLRPRLQATTGTVGALLQQLAQQLDERSGGNPIEDMRIGNRPVPLDGYPLIGWTSVTGLYALTGTYRDGFHAAPALGRHVAAEIAGRTGNLDVPFAPERAPIANWTVEGSIEEYATHMTSLWFELGGRAPSTFPTDAIRAGHRDEARRFYDRASIDLALNPDILCYLIAAPDKSPLIPLLRYLRATAGERAGASR